MTKKSEPHHIRYAAATDKRARRDLLIQRVLRLMTFSVLFLAGVMIWHTRQNQQNDMYADGQITGYSRTEMRDTRSGQQQVGWPLVKFITPDNSIVSFSSPDYLVCQPDCPTGTIGIYYRKDNPQKAQIADFGARYGEMIVWGAIGLVLLITYILYSWRLRILLRRRHGVSS